MTKRKETEERYFLLAVAFLLILFSQMIIVLAAPEGPSSINVTENRTKSANAAEVINISGGYISTINMTAVVQNIRWKAFIGWIDGRFTLDDASGQTIYDWSLSSITGEVYATRSSDTIEWGSIDCASIAEMEAENTAMHHSSAQDNITATFTQQAQTHDALTVSGVNIAANECNGTLNTYDSTGAAVDSNFQELVLFDGTDIVYSTILESDVAGYDSSNYDFQMIVPEDGAAGFTGKTAYYLYVELD